MKCIKLLAILVLLCVLKVRSDSIWVQGEGWVDYEFGDEHTISASSSPVNVSLAQSAVTIEFFADSFDNLYYDLGDLRNFGLLTSNDVYNTGNSSVYGNYGIFTASNSSSNSTSNSTETTLSNVPDGLEVEGTVEESSSSVSENALNTAKYLLNEASSFVCNNTFNDSESNLLGGQTLGVGFSCFEYDDLYIVGGDLKLDAGGSDDAYFVIRVNGALTVGSWGRSQTVKLINGGSSCNVYWIVQGSVLLHEGSSLIGTVIAGGDVQLGEDASVTGTVVSANGDITLYDAEIDNSYCSGDTREYANFTFEIWPAIPVPLDFEEEDQFLLLDDQSVGFEIVAEGGSFSYINFNLPPLKSNCTQALLLNSSGYSLECWYMAPFGIDIEKFDTLTQTSDGGWFFTTKVGQGTFFFVIVESEVESSSTGSNESSSSSSSSSTGTSQSSTGVESSTAVHSSTAVESSTGLPHSSSGVSHSSSGGGGPPH